jgi:hypothetical protein
VALLTFTKRYNRPEHSFMAQCVFSLETGETLNPNIFVVKDLEREFCLAEEIPPRLILGPATDVGGAEEGGESSSSGGSGSSSGGASCWSRVLVAIASLEDLLFKATVPTALGMLYLSDSAVILCQSRNRLEDDLERIAADVKIITKLQRREYSTLEVVTVEDVVLPNLVH